MSYRVRASIAAGVFLIAAGWISGQAPEDVPAALRQMQETLKRLQAEIKSLQDTVQRQANEAKRQKAAPVAAAKLSPPAGPLQKALEAYARGRQLEEQQLYRAAIDAYNEAILLDATNDAAWLRRGGAYFKLGELANAEADFGRSLAVQPDNSLAYLGRAQARAAMGQIQLAAADLNEAILRDDRNGESFLLRARLNEIGGDAQRATADYSMAISLAQGPVAERAYLGRASALLTRGEVERALSDCDAALRLNPNSSAAQLCRAEAYLRMRSPELAVEAVSKAVLAAQALNQPVPLLSYLGPSIEVDQLRTAQLAEALRPPPPVPAPAAAAPVIAEAVPAEPPAPVALAAPAPALAITAPLSPPAPKSGPVKSPLMASLEARREAERLDQLGRDYTAKQNFREALEMVSRAIELNPRYARAYNARGYVHLRMANYQPAIADFSEAIRLDPGYANAYHNRAVARRKVGDRAAAAADERSAAQLAAGISLSAQR